jgi:site-specific DNA recombinase
MSDVQPGTRVALYARVSGEEQKQGHNIDSQLAELESAVKQRGWTVAEVYRDEAWSGAALARPALDRMRDDAGKKRFDVVLINDVDRLARDVTHLGVIKRDLERNGVRVVFRKLPSDSSPTQNLLVNILGSFAEFERELIMDRTRRGRRHKVETRQQFIGCIPPYGYRYIPLEKPNRGGELVVNVEEASVVKKMFRWVDEEALSLRGVGLRLQQEGIVPRKGGKNWGRSSVRRIIRASVYSGTWHYNKLQGCYPRRLQPEAQARARKTSTRLRGREEWIPVVLPDSLRIVSEDRWFRVQKQIDRNRTFSPRNSKHQYLLSGLVRCGACGSSYVGNPGHGRFSYRCVKRCKRIPMVSERVLDTSVWSAVQSALNDPATLIRAVTGFDQPSHTADAEIEELSAAIQATEKEESRILEAYRLTVLTPEQLARELELLSARKKLLDKRKEELAKQDSSLPVRRSIEDYCESIRQRLGNLSFETKRNILRLLLRSIVYEGDVVRITGMIPLTRAREGISAGSDNTLLPSGEIEGTGINHCARNPAQRNAAFAQFSLVGQLQR